MSDPTQLSRRERQIMDALYRLGEASAAQVREELPDPPSKTAVRTLLRILEEKGHISHRSEGREFIYQPLRTRGRAGQSAMRGLLHTFFDDSLEKAVAAYLSDRKAAPSPEELERLERLIRDAKQKESQS